MFRVFTFLLLSIGLVIGQTTDINKAVVLVKDGDIDPVNHPEVTWTADNVYMMDGFVYVEDGCTLTINAGTVIKARQATSTGDIATALVIARGGKIYAAGTVEQPIIFTSEYDSVALKDYDLNDGVAFLTDRSLWGGVVVLGKAVLNVASEKVVEGLPVSEPRALYGGSDDADNSGVLRYISIRYTGITVEANKELQGLTLGCVGSGTEIEYIESFNSGDDGFEFFGGTVNTRYLVSAFNDDDAFDYDHGFRGKHQFWFAIQQSNAGDRIGEYDSGDADALTNEPLADPQIYNATYIGRGPDNTKLGLIYKEYGGGSMYNSIITEFGGYGVSVDSGSGLTSYSRLMDGTLNLENNIWYKEGVSGIADISNQSFLSEYLVAHTNFIENPMLKGISRTSGNGLDPRPAQDSPVWNLSRKSIPESDDFLLETNYLGAFGGKNWLKGWTALDWNDVAGGGAGVEIPTSIEAANTTEIPSEFTLNQNYPNPFNPITRIDFTLVLTGKVELSIYNILGQKVGTLVNGIRQAGSYTISFNASALPSGFYICSLKSENQTLNRKMILLK